MDEPQTESMLLGSALDCLRLEPAPFNHHYTTVPPDLPSVGKIQINAKKPSPETLSAIAFWHKFNEEHAHKTILPMTKWRSSTDEPGAGKAPANEGFSNCSKVACG
jgi:hypothetical protein